MKKLLLSILMLLTVSLFSQQSKYSVQKIWETPDMLTTSESVCFDSAARVLFVSCIDGNPTEKDGNGFISKLSLGGDIMEFRWAGNLNAPKGMGISEGFLYVTDIDRVLKLNLENGNLEGVFEADSAKFLNDITIGPDGAVYISDMHSTTVYIIENGRIGPWLSSSLFINPNGLNVLGQELLVGTSNGIFAVRFDDQSIRHLVKDTGGIDGLELFEDGYFLISDWSGKVQLVHPDRAPVVLLNTTALKINAADIEYIADRNMLVVPTFMDNRVTAYEIITE